MWILSVCCALPSAGDQRTAQTKGGIVKGIRELSIMMASAGMVATLLAVYFEWRARLLSRVRSFRKEE